MLDALNRSQAMIEFQMDGTIVTANDIFLKVMGYSLDEIKGRHHSLFVDDATRQSEEYRDFWVRLNRGEFDAGRYRRLARGGREVWLQATYNPVFDKSGRPVMVVKLAADVTEAAQVQIKAQREQQRLQQMVENASGRMIMADRDFKIVYMNPASVQALTRLEHLLPCRVDEILGKSIDIFHKQPEVQRRLLSDPKNLPHRANIKLGEETLDLHVSAIRDRHGEYIGPMVTWEVITEQELAKEREKLLQDQQRAAKEDLEQKVNALVEVVTRAADGDLTQNVEHAGDDDMGRLAAGMKRMLGDLRNLIGQVVEAANQQNEARTIAESSTNLSEGCSRRRPLSRKCRLPSSN